MRKVWTWITLFAMTTLSVVSVTIGKEEKEAEKPTLKLSECPQAVQKTLKREAGTAKLSEVEKESEGGGTLYTIDVKIDGRNYEIVVRENGVLESKDWNEEDNTEVVKLADCPNAVQKTLKREAGAAKIETVEKGSLYGHTTFAADALIDGKNYEITVTEAGALMSKLLDGDQDEEADEKKAKSEEKPEK